MDVNLLSLAQQALGGDFSKLAGQFLGESPGNTQSALTALLPAVLGGIAQKGSTADGASGLMSLISGANLDIGKLNNVAGLFGAGGGVNDLLKAGTSSLVPALFGEKSGALINTLSSMSGIKTTSAANLLAMTVPMVLTFLKKFIGDKGLNASALASLLSGQGANLQGALDSRLTSALGFASPTAFLSGLGGQAAEAARRGGAAIAGGVGAAGHAAANTTAAATVATKSGLMRWLPWLIGLVVLWFLWNQFASKPTPPAPATSSSEPAAAATATAPAAAGFPAKVYFDTGSAMVGDDASKTIVAAAEEINKDGLKISITGYTDRTGDTAKNEELAKSRADAVRDALMGAGVAETSIDMKPPMFVEVGAGGSDAEARRVDINRE